MSDLSITSTEQEKFEALKHAADYFNSDLTQVIGRDDNGKLLFVAVHAKGSYAVALERWLKRLAKREAKQ
jgi:predicted GIY-YIG superfamily endonuclease